MRSVVHVDVAQNFEIVVDRIRKIADTTVDAGAIVGGLLLPGSISDRVAKAYDSTLSMGQGSTCCPTTLRPAIPASSSTRPTRLAIRHFGRRCTRELI